MDRNDIIHSLNHAYGGKYFFSQEDNVIFAGKAKRFLLADETIGSMLAQSRSCIWSNGEWVSSRGMGELKYCFSLKNLSVVKEQTDTIIKLEIGNLYLFPNKNTLGDFVRKEGKNYKFFSHLLD